MSLDWSSIGAATAAFLALAGSVFSAIAAARSADVAVQAEKRAASATRLAAQRELSRSVARGLALVESTLLLLHRADTTAASNASFYRDPGKYASTRAEISSRRALVEGLDSSLKAIGEIEAFADEELASMQLEMDRAGIKLENEREWAAIRSGELKEANRSLSDDLTAEELARGIHPRRDASGKIY
jgi:hypothetical protein